MGILSNLFTTKSQEENAPANPSRHDQRGSGETYQQWGTRWAGHCNASQPSLGPALQVVQYQIKKEQQQDDAQQQANRNSIQSQIDIANNNIANEEQKIAQSNATIDTANEEIKKKETEIRKLDESGPDNKLATIYFYIGLTVVLLLAGYLWMFYTSAGYSAFFGGEDIDEMQTAIFDPGALSKAWSNSWGQLAFLILLPIIFLGLGILIHYFINKKGIAKYFKVTALYIVTFAFDVLLAYEISEKMFTPTKDHLTYTMSDAFDSPHFWIVIFAGFIAYVIWGLVFDFMMESYKDKISNDRQIGHLKDDIAAQKAIVDNELSKIATINQTITDLRNKKTQLQAQLNNTVIFNLTAIKLELNNFFLGWVAYMQLQGFSQADQSQARSVLDTTLAALG